jgi:hypothetical protein
MYNRDEPTEFNAYQATHAALIIDSHRRLLGHDLLARHGNPSQLARELYETPCVVLTHDTASDPIFFYANLRAQQLFEMSWEQMIALPSRHSAEPLAQSERQRLLDRVARHGFIDDYTGVRVSRTGKRFLIERATVWNLIDQTGTVMGQAAAFDHWTPLA